MTLTAKSPRDAKTPRRRSFKALGSLLLFPEKYFLANSVFLGDLAVNRYPASSYPKPIFRNNSTIRASLRNSVSLGSVFSSATAR